MLGLRTDESGNFDGTGAEMLCSSYLRSARCFCSEWQKQRIRSQRAYSLRLPADWHHSCSQHGCEIAKAENSPTSLSTSVFIVIVCAFVCAQTDYKGSGPWAQASKCHPLEKQLLETQTVCHFETFRGHFASLWLFCVSLWSFVLATCSIFVSLNGCFEVLVSLWLFYLALGVFLLIWVVMWCSL